MLLLSCHAMAFMVSTMGPHRASMPVMSLEGNGCPMLPEPVQSSSEQTLTVAMG